MVLGSAAPAEVIIDAHTHLGSCRVFGRDHSVPDVTEPMNRFGIAVSIIQPFPGAPDPTHVHDEIYRLGQETGGRFVGLASLSPHGDRQAYQAEVRRCVERLGFVGVKLHTLGHAVNPAGADGETVFQTARELGIPVMVHTGMGAPFADPGQLMGPADKFPDVTIVLAHAGAAISSATAIGVAQRCGNVVLEPSWCRTNDIKAMIDAVGADRVMFGTDTPENIAVEFAKYGSLTLDDTVRAAVFHGTARRVFKLDGVPADI